MELQLPFNLFSFCLFLSFITLILRRQWTRRNTGKLPPGPWKLPLIGNMHHLVGAIPHVALRDMSKKYGKDLMHLQLGQVSAVVVSSAEVAKLFLKTHDLDFADRPRVVAGDEIFYNRSDLFFSPYGDYWKQMRKVCMTELLSARTVRSFSHIRQDEIHRLLDRVRSSSHSPINIFEEMSIFTSSIICRAAFGKTLKKAKELLKVIDEILILGSSFCMADMFPSWKILHLLAGEKSRMVKVRRKADEIMGNIINQHRNNLDCGKTGSGESGAEDIVDVLLKLKDSNTLPVSITDDNIKCVILDMFGGGVDTSTTTTACAMVEMVKNPRVLAKAQAEVRQAFKGKQTSLLDENDVEKLPYLSSVIKETLRLHPTGSMILRECKKETLVRGYTIPPKTRLIINAWAMSRDPEYWEDPESFKPERFEDNPMDYNGSQLEYMPFGAGRRICPGISFGLANVQTPLAYLLYHFDWKFPHGITPDGLEIAEKPGIVIKPKNDLLLIAAPAPLAAV
nr:premnaspirodiene oxygenase-like [Ipomoea batatas]